MKHLVILGAGTAGTMVATSCLRWTTSSRRWISSTKRPARRCCSS